MSLSTMQPDIDISVVIVSLNTSALLAECLGALKQASAGLRVETFIVDNGSRDDSVARIRRDWPEVQLIESGENLGFGRANNVALERAKGRYLVLLNSDAFLAPDALTKSVAYMDRDASIGLGGARLIGRDGSWQPSARMFPSVLTDAFVMTGLAGRFPGSRLFGRFDCTWADQTRPLAVDWVPGAYSMIRAGALAKVGLFDPRFFLYYEEVDLCLRIKNAGYSIWYWPDVVVTHIGGESSKQLSQTQKSLKMSSAGSQLTLWRMRSTLLYYRKNHGWQVYLAWLFEALWSGQRALRKRLSSDPERRRSGEQDSAHVALLRQAWRETGGGRYSPAQPW